MPVRVMPRRNRFRANHCSVKNESGRVAPDSCGGRPPMGSRKEIIVAHNGRHYKHELYVNGGPVPFDRRGRYRLPGHSGGSTETAGPLDLGNLSPLHRCGPNGSRPKRQWNQPEHS